MCKLCSVTGGANTANTASHGTHPPIVQHGIIACIGAAVQSHRAHVYIPSHSVVVDPPPAVAARAIPPLLARGAQTVSTSTLPTENPSPPIQNDWMGYYRCRVHLISVHPDIYTARPNGIWHSPRLSTTLAAGQSISEMPQCNSQPRSARQMCRSI